MSDGHGHGPPSVKAETVKIIVWTLAFVCAVTVVADLFYEKAGHVHYGFEEIIGFHAFYGFVSCVVLVLAASWMRKLVMRDEDYYDRD
jgi:hypothetical protein